MQVSASTTDTAPSGLPLLGSARLRHWAGLLTSLLAGQGAVQLINVITGFFLLRWMSVEAYAQFSVAFGFQSMMQWLVDLGAGGAVIALVGDRGRDREVVGKYIHAAKRLRLRLLCLAAPLAAVIFPLVTSKHQWPWALNVLLFSSVIATLYFQGWATFYSVPLLINQNIGRFYRPQIVSSVWKLALCSALKLGSGLFSWTSAWANASAVALHGLVYRRETRHLAVEPKEVDERASRELRGYLAPTVPWVVFTAFQGQISLLLIIWFGQTRDVAEVAALGRIGQLFLILAVANAVIISPYVARVQEARLPRRYVQILCLALCIATLICAAAFLFPRPFLWVLGPNYANLGRELGWAVAGSCAWYVGSVMMAMHNARKWVYWWWSTAHIVALLATQVAASFILDLSRPLHVFYFSLATNLAALLVLCVAAIYGFIYGPPKRLR